MKKESNKAAMKHMCYLTILLLVGWSLGPVMAADEAVPPPKSDTPPVVAPVDPATDVDTWEANPAKDAERSRQLATTYGVPETQVLAMRQTSRMGWGEIKNLLLISQRVAADSVGSETPLTQEQALAQVVNQRQSGMGVGQIANSYNVKLGTLHNVDNPGKVDKVERPGKPEKPERPDKPDKPQRPDKPDKPDKPEKLDKPAKGI